MSDSLSLQALTAVSAVDGRYATRTEVLRGLCSEYALMRYRVAAEVAWFLTLADEPGIAELAALDSEARAFVAALPGRFTIADAERIKTLEQRTNHDVKAVEYWIKERFDQHPETAAVREFVHFACTSEDINNLAYALMLKAVRSELLLPAVQRIEDALCEFAERNRGVAMLARTHGQPASPTTIDKELMNVVARLRRTRRRFAEVTVLGKINGAVGNYNAHAFAYPDVDWPALADTCVTSLGLTLNPMTTQIEPHDWIAEYCDALARVGRVVLDLDRDVWAYIAIDYFGQRAVEGETGSSTMPHKVNPIDFENSEGNIGVACALLHHLSEKLVISRWQRDLSDSTALRTLGTAFAHMLVALQSTLRGFARLTVNRAAMARDLDGNWEVLAEPVQTLMRRAGLEAPYERLKALTRGERLTADRYRQLIEALELPEALRERLLALTPADYVGLATRLADEARERP